MYPLELAAVGAYLTRRREAILQAWRRVVTADPTLTTGTSLPPAQLRDHIPALLVDFERRLSGGALAADAQERRVHQGDAAAHGLHRWQQGFNLSEVTRELGRLNECVVVELETYAASDADIPAAAMAEVRRIWAQQCGDAVSVSVSQYFQLQQIEATSHIRDLELALQSLRELEQERARLWQEAAHDLRGGLGVVASATAGLTSPRASEPMRERFAQLLDRNVGSLSHLLNDVTSLARLQGGLEHRVLATVDVTAMLASLCEEMQPYAQQRGLYLRFETDADGALSVQGDGVKIRRIAQNLVINALKYTRSGGVTVSCGDSVAADRDRWFLEVQDTGPGFHAGPGSWLAGAIEEATEHSSQVQADHARGAVTHANVDLAATAPTPGDPRAVESGPGEGIGLSIVKRLCELLDASTELRSEMGVGTRFRILLPRQYGDGSPQRAA